MSATSTRRRLTNTVKQSLRDVRSGLGLLNHQVSARLSLRDTDLECLDLISRHGPLSPKALATLAAVHPATLTGILDRLERDGWLARERDPADRRGVLLRALRERGAEMLGLYSGMNSAMDDICAAYTPEELQVIADFLHRVAQAGVTSAETLASRP